MSKPFVNPFFEADMSKMFNYGDMSKIFDMSKTMSDFKMPQMPMMDMEAITALQRKNVEAFTSMSQATYESLQSLMRRQMDSYRQMTEEMMQMSQAIMACPTPEAKVIKQAEASKAAIFKCISNLRDASETVAKCNTQAMETVGSRLNESLTEMCGAIKNVNSCAA